MMAVPFATAVAPPFASIETTEESLERQVTVLFVALDGVIVTASVDFAPMVSKTILEVFNTMTVTEVPS